jgi:hypothetical protein
LLSTSCQIRSEFSMDYLRSPMAIGVLHRLKSRQRGQ